MINIQKYNNLADYTQDKSRPADECAVSQIDNGVKYDGVNVILKGNQLDENDVCCVFIDTLTGPWRGAVAFARIKSTFFATKPFTIVEQFAASPLAFCSSIFTSSPRPLIRASLKPCVAASSAGCWTS